MSRSMASSTIVFLLFDLGNALACSAGSNNATDACTSKGLVQTPPDETVLLQLRVQPAPAPSHQVAEESQNQNQPTKWVEGYHNDEMGPSMAKIKFKVPEYFMPPAPIDSEAQVPVDADGLTSSGALPAGSTSFPIDVSVSELKETWGPFFNTDFTVVIDRFTPKEEILHVQEIQENKGRDLADLMLADKTKYSHEKDTKVEVLQSPWGRLTQFQVHGDRSRDREKLNYIEVVPFKENAFKRIDFTGEQLAVELKKGAKKAAGWRSCKVQEMQKTTKSNGAVKLVLKADPGLRATDRISSYDEAYYYNVDNPNEASVEPIIQPIEAWAIQKLYLRRPSHVF